MTTTTRRPIWNPYTKLGRVSAPGRRGLRCDTESHCKPFLVGCSSIVSNPQLHGSKRPLNLPQPSKSASCRQSLLHPQVLASGSGGWRLPVPFRLAQYSQSQVFNDMFTHLLPPIHKQHNGQLREAMLYLHDSKKRSRYPIHNRTI